MSGMLRSRMIKLTLERARRSIASSPLLASSNSTPFRSPRDARTMRRIVGESSTTSIFLAVIRKNCEYLSGSRASRHELGLILSHKRARSSGLLEKPMTHEHSHAIPPTELVDAHLLGREPPRVSPRALGELRDQQTSPRSGRQRNTVGRVPFCRPLRGFPIANDTMLPKAARTCLGLYALAHSVGSTNGVGGSFLFNFSEGALPAA